MWRPGAASNPRSNSDLLTRRTDADAASTSPSRHAHTGSASPHPIANSRPLSVAHAHVRSCRTGARVIAYIWASIPFADADGAVYTYIHSTANGHTGAISHGHSAPHGNGDRHAPCHGNGDRHADPFADGHPGADGHPIAAAPTVEALPDGFTRIRHARFPVVAA